MENEFEDEDEPRYQYLDALDFSIITMGMKKLPFYEDDLYLGMQAMNVGIVDPIITKQEYDLLCEYNDLERTPIESALALSALSQMWIYGLYEVLRLWRERRYRFEQLRKNGGINGALKNMVKDDDLNMTIDTRRAQLERYRDDAAYREGIDRTWTTLEPVYRIVELFRMNFAKHASPGKDNVLARAPGYGRINSWCGALDFELIDSDGNYTTMNRRDVAESLRLMLQKI